MNIQKHPYQRKWKIFILTQIRKMEGIKMYMIKSEKNGIVGTVVHMYRCTTCTKIKATILLFL